MKRKLLLLVLVMLSCGKNYGMKRVLRGFRPTKTVIFRQYFTNNDNNNGDEVGVFINSGASVAENGSCCCTDEKEQFVCVRVIEKKYIQEIQAINRLLYKAENSESETCVYNSKIVDKDYLKELRNEKRYALFSLRIDFYSNKLNQEDDSLCEEDDDL